MTDIEARGYARPEALVTTDPDDDFVLQLFFDPPGPPPRAGRNVGRLPRTLRRRVAARPPRDAVSSSAVPDAPSFAPGVLPGDPS